MGGHAGPRAIGLVAALWAGAALADEGPGTISTHATARSRLANTVADVSLGIEAEGRTVAAVQSALGQGSQRLTAFLREQPVERLRTGRIGVSTVTEQQKGQPERITGYTGTLEVSFRVPAAQLGAVVGGAMGQGANTVGSTSLQPREGEIDAARRDLAADAVRTALAQARAVAEAAGQSLGPIQRIEVDAPSRPRFPVAPGPMRAMAASPAIATEAGDTEVEMQVSVTVALAGPTSGGAR